ncbi:MAG: protein-methionine-sulfoxide reductase catalytic subunit MsrP [Candidatus Hydrogenedentota bacterium]
MAEPVQTKPPSSSEITPEGVYQARRAFMKNAALMAGTAALTGTGLLGLMKIGPNSIDAPEEAAVGSGDVMGDIVKNTKWDPGEDKTPYKDVTAYNNFYEFGIDKSDPAAYASTLQPRPWTITVEGECAKPQVIDIDQLVKWFPLEERVYRMRCVEAWSMVIPWVGYSLGDLLKKLEPTSRAKYVAFTTLHDPDQMPGQKGGSLDWPYVEGLRLDEAMNPLTLLAVGLYGKVLPNQNGAPIRLVVPWKYGFKGIKSIVSIRFTEEQPPTTWNKTAPREYGFYANVNPDVPHPRWSQASERRIGEWTRRATLPFNGYGADVAAMYAGMDLKVNY